MSVRTVLAVVLAVALCSVSYPAIEDARTIRAEYHAEGELASLSRAMADLDEESAVPLGDPGARRVVTLSLPRATATNAGIEFVAIGGVPRNETSKDAHGDVLAYRVEGGATHVQRVPFDLRVATYDTDDAGDANDADADDTDDVDDAGGGWQLEPDRKPLVVRDSRTKIALVLVEHHDERTILVVRASEL